MNTNKIKFNEKEKIKYYIYILNPIFFYIYFLFFKYYYY